MCTGGLDDRPPTNKKWIWEFAVLSAYPSTSLEMQGWGRTMKRINMGGVSFCSKRPTNPKAYKRDFQP